VNVLRYSFAALRADYLRAGIGLALTLGPMLFIPVESPALYILGPAALLFLIFGLRTWQHHATRVEFDDTGISLFSLRRVSLGWNDLRAVKLSYYSTRADRTGGWMQLTLKGEGPRTIRLESSLDGFDRVAQRAAAAVRHNGIELTPATQSNFSMLGIDAEALSRPGEAA
jgi:hypothetical protein